jgi:hypothetical protein
MRRILAVALALLLYAVAIPAVAQNVQHGEFKFSSESEGWTLHQGEGPRTFQYIVTFDRPYESAPIVSCSMTGFDAATDKNVRVNIKVEKVTITGFVVRVTTWADTKLFSVAGEWLALGK